jgi:hypothetical protein
VCLLIKINLYSIEHGIVVLDQSGHMYVLASPSLRLIWSARCPSHFQSGYAFDHSHVQISCSGEVVIQTAFGDFVRYSILSNDIATEIAALQWVRISDEKEEMIG